MKPTFLICDSGETAVRVDLIRSFYIGMDHSIHAEMLDGKEADSYGKTVCLKKCESEEEAKKKLIRLVACANGYDEDPEIESFSSSDPYPDFL